jgi:hypothetical protein
MGADDGWLYRNVARVVGSFSEAGVGMGLAGSPVPSSESWVGVRRSRVAWSMKAAPGPSFLLVEVWIFLIEIPMLT